MTCPPSTLVFHWSGICDRCSSIFCWLLLGRKDKGGISCCNLNFLHFGYPHLLQDDNITDLGDDATTDPHSTTLLYTVLSRTQYFCLVWSLELAAACWSHAASWCSYPCSTLLWRSGFTKLNADLSFFPSIVKLVDSCTVLTLFCCQINAFFYTLFSSRHAGSMCSMHLPQW